MTVPTAAVHGPFQGKTWLVTSTPLPPSRVHVMAGLRSFEARRPAESSGDRRARRPPLPPPRSSSLRRIRGAVSETDLRRRPSRPVSPALSACSERPPRAQQHTHLQLPSFSSFRPHQPCETIDELPTIDSFSVQNFDQTLRPAPNECSAEMSSVLSANSHGDVSTERHGKDDDRTTTIACIDRILSSMHTLQQTLETTADEPSPELQTKERTATNALNSAVGPENTDQRAQKRDDYQHNIQKFSQLTDDRRECKLINKTQSPKTLDQMFSEIETLYDNLTATAKANDALDSKSAVEKSAVETSQDEPVYENIAVLSDICEEQSRLMRPHGGISTQARLQPSDYIACSTPKLDNRRLMNGSVAPLNGTTAPPYPSTPLPPGPYAQYDVPRSPAPSEAVYDTPRLIAATPPLSKIPVKVNSVCSITPVSITSKPAPVITTTKPSTVKTANTTSDSASSATPSAFPVIPAGRSLVPTATTNIPRASPTTKILAPASATTRGAPPSAPVKPTTPTSVATISRVPTPSNSNIKSYIPVSIAVRTQLCHRHHSPAAMSSVPVTSASTPDNSADAATTSTASAISTSCSVSSNPATPVIPSTVPDTTETSPTASATIAYAPTVFPTPSSTSQANAGTSKVSKILVTNAVKKPIVPSTLPLPTPVTTAQATAISAIAESVLTAPATGVNMSPTPTYTERASPVPVATENVTPVSTTTLDGSQVLNNHLYTSYAKTSSESVPESSISSKISSATTKNAPQAADTALSVSPLPVHGTRAPAASDTWRAEARTMTPARRHAVELVIGDRIRLPTVPSHDPVATNTTPQPAVAVTEAQPEHISATHRQCNGEQSARTANADIQGSATARTSSPNKVAATTRVLIISTEAATVSSPAGHNDDRAAAQKNPHTHGNQTVGDTRRPNNCNKPTTTSDTHKEKHCTASIRTDNQLQRANSSSSRVGGVRKNSAERGGCGRNSAVISFPPVEERARQLQRQLGDPTAAAAGGDGRGSLGGCTRQRASPSPDKLHHTTAASAPLCGIM